MHKVGWIVDVRGRFNAIVTRTLIYKLHQRYNSSLDSYIVLYYKSPWDKSFDKNCECMKYLVKIEFWLEKKKERLLIKLSGGDELQQLAWNYTFLGFSIYIVEFFSSFNFLFRFNDNVLTAFNCQMSSKSIVNYNLSLLTLGKLYPFVLLFFLIIFAPFPK